EGLGGDEGPHVEEAVRLARGVAVDDREVRTDRLGWIERHRQREKEAARRSLERGVRSRQMFLDQFLEGALAVVQRFGNVRPHLASAVATVEFRYALENLGDGGDGGIELGHR